MTQNGWTNMYVDIAPWTMNSISLLFSPPAPQIRHTVSRAAHIPGFLNHRMKNKTEPLIHIWGHTQCSTACRHLRPTLKLLLLHQILQFNLRDVMPMALIALSWADTSGATQFSSALDRQQACQWPHSHSPHNLVCWATESAETCSKVGGGLGKTRTGATSTVWLPSFHPKSPLTIQLPAYPSQSTRCPFPRCLWYGEIPTTVAHCASPKAHRIYQVHTFENRAQSLIFSYC